MQGVLFSIIGGVLICLQGVLTTRISDKIGLWETNTLVHFFGMILALIFLLSQGGGNFSKIAQVNVLYWPGLCIGAVILFSIMKSISCLGPTWATIILLVAQLIFAMVIECNGWFGTEPVKINLTKLAGIMIMITGIIVFKLKDL